MKTNKKPLIATMLLVSLFQMGMVAMSPVVASITTAFPGTSDTAAQLAMTFFCLVSVGMATLTGTISKHISRRIICAAGMTLTSIGGFCGTFLTAAFPLVFVWSALLGIGLGLFVPCVSSMMIDFLTDEERGPVLGIQSAMVNLGGVLLSFLSGILAAQHWTWAYLVYLISLPVIFLCLKFIPEEPKKAAPVQKSAEPAKKAKIPGVVLLAALQTFLFAVFYFAFSTNISLLISERAIGGTSLSGTATAVFMLGGCVFGLLFAKVSAIFKNKMPAVAFLMVALSDLVIYFIPGIVPLMLAAFVGGGSLSLIFPYFLGSVANKVDPAVSVISASLILTVGPNLGSFISPMILTGISDAMFGTVAGRFLLAAICSVVLAAILLIFRVNRSDQ